MGYKKVIPYGYDYYKYALVLTILSLFHRDKGIICKLLKNCLNILEKDGNRNPEVRPNIYFTNKMFYRIVGMENTGDIVWL